MKLTFAQCLKLSEEDLKYYLHLAWVNSWDDTYFTIKALFALGED